ncbi:hypothetical protein [Okeania sp. KiyG1]|uniref:hypothetical protein n=1 Tax=Okeania sp. KiyG1 TaxID=2720165 RepID=UPI00192185CA|nr:hypothetical protein [Okeania sp. KiyG1]
MKKEEGRRKKEEGRSGWGVKPQPIVNTVIDGWVLNPKEKDKNFRFILLIR